jgi:hypothetical protein
MVTTSLTTVVVVVVFVILQRQHRKWQTKLESDVGPGGFEIDAPHLGQYLAGDVVVPNIKSMRRKSCKFHYSPPLWEP